MVKKQVPEMEIMVAKRAGFCFGVKRATNMAFEAAAKHDCLCSLGPIIHSPQVVARLEEVGVKVIDDVDSLHAETVIVRSHGITSGELAALEQT